MVAWANLEVSESTVTTTSTVTLARRCRAIEIINDSGSRSLQFKFKAGETFSTLKPLESWSSDYSARTILLKSPSSKSVAYRIRALG